MTYEKLLHLYGWSELAFLCLSVQWQCGVPGPLMPAAVPCCHYVSCYPSDVSLSPVIGRSPHDTRPPAPPICLRGFDDITDITHNSRWWSNVVTNYPVNTRIMSHTWLTSYSLITALVMVQTLIKTFTLVVLGFNWHEVARHHESTITIKSESWASVQLQSLEESFNRGELVPFGLRSQEKLLVFKWNNYLRNGIKRKVTLVPVEGIAEPRLQHCMICHIE